LWHSECYMVHRSMHQGTITAGLNFRPYIKYEKTWSGLSQCHSEPDEWTYRYWKGPGSCSVGRIERRPLGLPLVRGAKG